MNMIKSTNSFHMKRIDMLYEENDKSLAKFEAKR